MRNRGSWRPTLSGSRIHDHHYKLLDNTYALVVSRLPRGEGKGGGGKGKGEESSNIPLDSRILARTSALGRSMTKVMCILALWGTWRLLANAR